MRRFTALALAAFLPTTLFAETAEPRVLAPIVAMGAYVATDDMEGSVAFYRKLFDSAPVVGLPDFVAFDVAGGWFAVVSRKKYAPGSEPGLGAVPYLQATDLEELRARATATGIAAPEIIEESGIHLLKITDPNGQLIEFFKLTDQ
ncbi:VOC family protein [Ruegeria atlantica]|uniref:VOC family protein n=1 Tax=Ruegeria atlantica TaxID=81569 RepID=UPI00147CBE8A|nr:VOC family protein [Ruegeria atlantica]